jgi:hypothetical protein
MPLRGRSRLLRHQLSCICVHCLDDEFCTLLGRQLRSGLTLSYRLTTQPYCHTGHLVRQEPHEGECTRTRMLPPFTLASATKATETTG